MATRQEVRLFMEELIQGASFSPVEEKPLVRGTILEVAPKATIGYDHINDEHDAGAWLHFYVHDHRFLSLYHPRRQFTTQAPNLPAKASVAE